MNINETLKNKWETPLNTGLNPKVVSICQITVSYGLPSSNMLNKVCPQSPISFELPLKLLHLTSFRSIYIPSQILHVWKIWRLP